jgi:hypothetical protein
LALRVIVAPYNKRLEWTGPSFVSGRGHMANDAFDNS